jgi:2,4-dienoyl-CoA reductase-like NADH-dependent reductase (Old Yellow Enzyme family)
MSNPSPFDPMTFVRGPAMKNRFMLAPLTNLQSFPDGKLSDDEHHWLTMRAKGEFGLTMTCAAHVQARGQGFPGQLGVFSDTHIEGLTRLAASIHEHNSVAVVQLHHAGMRSPADLIGETPVCPSPNEETGARGLANEEVVALRENFINAAVRSERAGFDGVELHGAHGYVLCQFLSADINSREDEYGGTLENRSRLLFEIIDGIRGRCRPDFNLGVRLSPERFGIVLAEACDVAQRLMREGKVDYIDMSLWDVFKAPVEDAYAGTTLLSHFTALDRGDVRLGVAGKIKTAAHVRRCLDEGADFVLLGRAAILHHDFPAKAKDNADFEAVALPVSADYLREEGLGEAFVEYMDTWRGFVSPAA